MLAREVDGSWKVAGTSDPSGKCLRTGSAFVEGVLVSAKQVQAKRELQKRQKDFGATIQGQKKLTLSEASQTLKASEEARPPQK